MNVASVTNVRPTKRQKTITNGGVFKGDIELKKYSREEYDSMMTAQQQRLYKLQKKAELIKSKKTPESSKALDAIVWALEMKTKNSSD